MEAVSMLLSVPTEKTLGLVKRTKDLVMKKKEKGSSRLVILALTKVFFNLLPTYNVHTTGFKYTPGAASANYEYFLVEEWQRYLKMITRSKTDESYEAAAILLPQTVLFNKSGKLIGKVLKGTTKKGKIGAKCRKVLKKLFMCDKGNRVVKILEVVNQMPVKKLSRHVLRLFPHINDGMLAKPVRAEEVPAHEMRKLTVEEKAVKKEAQLHFLPEEMKAWRGINERLLRIYLLVVTQKRLEKYPFVIGEIRRLRVPGNLHEGIFTVLTEKIAELKKSLTPAAVGMMFDCYLTLNTIFKKRLEISYQLEELEKIPLETLVQLDTKEIQRVYSLLQGAERHGGPAALIKLLIRRGMHRIDADLPHVVKHLMPKDGPKALEVFCEGGFWELALLRKGKR